MNYRNPEKRKIMKITVCELCEKLDILNSLEKMKMTESMHVYDPKAYPWNHAVGPLGDEECYPYYEPPVDYDAYDEYELSVYYIGDNLGMEEYDAED